MILDGSKLVTPIFFGHDQKAKLYNCTGEMSFCFFDHQTQNSLGPSEEQVIRSFDY